MRREFVVVVLSAARGVKWTPGDALLLAWIEACTRERSRKKRLALTAAILRERANGPVKLRCPEERAANQAALEMFEPRLIDLIAA